MKTIIFLFCCILFLMSCGGSNNNFWTDAREKMVGQWQFTTHRSTTPTGQPTVLSTKTFAGNISKYGSNESDIQISYYSHLSQESALPHIYNSVEFYSYIIDSLGTKKVRGSFSNSFYSVNFIYEKTDSVGMVKDSVTGYKIY